MTIHNLCFEPLESHSRELPALPHPATDLTHIQEPLASNARRSRLWLCSKRR